MKWVTWEYIGVDRMACSWLILRFIDPNAEFIFIPAGSINIPDGAEAFDIPGVKYTHYRGHCSFHTMVQAFELTDDPVLQQLARIVDEADTIQEISLEAIAPGLDAVCQGIRLTSKDDYEAIEKGRQVYDALYKYLSQGTK